jgi:hypothetical protein
MQTFKAVGHRGDWFATIDDEQVPCAWNWWLTGMHYCDRGAKPGRGKWMKYINAISSSRKVALTGKKETKNGKWERDGYIGLFAIANLTTTERGLEFDLTQRLANLK